MTWKDWRAEFGPQAFSSNPAHSLYLFYSFASMSLLKDFTEPYSKMFIFGGDA